MSFQQSIHSVDTAPDPACMHAIYSTADEFRWCGFVDPERRERVLAFLDPDAGCYVSDVATPNTDKTRALRHARLLEGIPSWRP